MENSSNVYVKNSTGTFLDNITKNTRNILGGVDNTQENNTQENNNKEIKGKYQFIKNTVVSVCIETEKRSGYGIDAPPCVKYKYYNYKIGDVIDVQNFYFSTEKLAKLPIKEQNLGVALSYLQKVSDTTPLSKENISFGNTYKDNLTQGNSTNVPTKSGGSVFTKLAGAYNKNLIIAVVLVAGYLAYKKFKK
jgi:hypothetical protein